MRLASVQIGETTELPREVELPPSGGAFVLFAPYGPTKTLFFELIATAKERIGPYGVAGSVLWPPVRGAARVALRFALDESEREFAATTADELEAEVFLGMRGPLEGEAHAPGLAALLRRVDGPDTGRFELVPAERSLVGSPPGGGLPGRVQAMLLLSSHVKKYAGLPGRLVDLARDGSPAFDAFRSAFDELSPVTKSLGLRRGGDRPELLFQRGRRSVGFDDLGLDEQQYVLFAGIAALTPKRRSILMIDEPELHLSAAGARDLVDKLPRVLGEQNQVLVGTRSDSIADAAPPTHIVRWTS